MSIGTQPIPRYTKPTAQKRAVTQSGPSQMSAAKPTFGLNTVSFGEMSSQTRPITPRFMSSGGEVGHRLNFLA